MKRKSTIPTIIGIILLFGGIVAGVFLLRNNQMFKIGASPGAEPKNVRISNISDSSATVSWITGDPTATFVSYGTSSNLGTLANEGQGDQKYNTHSITITGLSPSTNYYFKIISDGTTFDNNSVPWQFTTGVSLSINQKVMPVSGSVITAAGAPSRRAIVYITVGGYLVSTLTSDKGTFILQLSSARTPDLTTYAEIDPGNTLLEVSVISETGESATAKIFQQSANPIPALIIGQSQDFRNLEPSINGQNPNANLDVPDLGSSISKLDVSGEKTDTSQGITLDSIDEGEIITSTTPEFFGEAPAGSSITITVHSDTEISGITKSTDKGKWSWSPDNGLSEGSHSVTLSWIDTSGITRTITRNFIVQAGELPSYEASPSGTPGATIKPTITPKASVIPTSTPTPESLPETGILTPTIILSIMGLGLFAFSAFLWKFSES